MKLLICGASGLLGRKIVKIALKREIDVYGTYKDNPIDVLNSIRIDLSDRSAVLDLCQKIRPNVIINSAALTDVDLCEREKNLAIRINADIPGFLAEAAQIVGAYILHVSTDYVFDGKKGMYSENDKPNPINNYGRSKLLGETQVSSKTENWCVARTSVIIGWERERRPNFAIWVLKGLRENRKLNVVIDQHISPTLNTNLAKMLLEIAEKKLQGVYHVAGCDRINRFEMALMIAEKFNLNKTLLCPVNSSSINWLAQRPKDSSLDVDKISKELKNKPLHIDDAINEMKNSEKGNGR